MRPTFRAVALLAAVLPLVACETLKSERSDRSRDRGTESDDGDEDVLQIRARNANGPVLYVVVGDELRTGSRGGEVAYFRDTPFVRRKGEEGRHVFFVREGEVRKNDKNGEIVLFFDGRNIRSGAEEDAPVLFHWKGNDIRRGSRDGERVLFVDRNTPRWAVACALQGMY